MPLKNKGVIKNRKVKISKIINNFLVLFFLFLISFITLPEGNLNSYTLEKESNGQLPNAKDRVIDLFSKPKVIKTETRDYSDLVKDNANEDREYNNSYQYLGAFSYTASNFDLVKSDLRFDYISTGISFYPDIVFNEVNKKDLSFEVINKFDKQECLKDDGVFEDAICINSDCLKQIGNQLYFNNLELQFPSFNGEISDLSISNLDNNFIISLTVKEKNNYKAYIYEYDDYIFKELKNVPEIISKDFGYISIGGSLNDYIILYGSTQGIAYRVEENKVSNISSFFDFRIMNKGFKPEIIRVDDGKRVDFYVYSLSCDKSIFVKLWENNKGEISGELSFTNELNIFGEKLYLYLDDYTNTYRKFYLYSKDIRGEKYYQFYDYGFKNKTEASLLSKLMPFSSSKNVNIEHIHRSGVEIMNNNDYFIFQISIDNKEYLDINDYSKDDLRDVSNYILKTTFKPMIDKFYSPYITKIFFDYGYTRL